LPGETLTVALVSDVFFSSDAVSRLLRRLALARDGGAELAVLPELPLNPWSPATREARADDAEEPGGLRHRALAAAARKTGIAVLGGAIVRDGAGRRFNTALLFSSSGELVASYRKLHLPEEPGFWETSHYEPGEEPPRVVRELAFPFGIQICSDVNRPTVSHALAAAGAEAIIAPRATERETFESWKLVFRANALTSTAYVLSVNRPEPEQGVPLGGPSVAVAPDGSVLAESVEPVVVVTLARGAVARARADYPGYLKVRPELYARAWLEGAARPTPRM
jgi:predicted amidohydrolase